MHKNNFDFLRLLFSSTVILSHSFPLTGKKEFFEEATNSQLDLGTLSVNIFFILSGYLIFNSLVFSKSLLNYLWKRIVRLFPALLVMLLVTLIIILAIYGPAMLRNPEYYSYVPNNLSLYYLQFKINPAFATNPYARIINGSLWSLSYEFTMYLIVALFYPFRKNEKLTTALLGLTFMALLLLKFLKPAFIEDFLQVLNLTGKQFYRLAPYFIGGCLLSRFNISGLRKAYVKYGLAAGLILALALGKFSYVSYFLLPPLIILIGQSYSSALSAIPKRIGDISYGIYIYGFLIQQTLMHFFDLNVATLFVLSFLVCIVPAYLSYHYIEKPAMKYKDLL